MDKRKRFKLTLEIFRDIMKIYPRVQGQDFDALHTDEEIVSFLRELRHTMEINSLNDVVVDHMHQLWRTFVALINKSLSGKKTGATPSKKARKFKKPASPQLTTVPVSPEEPIKKSKRGNDEDDSNNEQDYRSKGSDEENDSDDKNTQSDSKKGSDFEHETDENESDSKSDQEENEEEIGDDEGEEEDEFVRTPSNDSYDETKNSDKGEGDEDEEMDYTTSQLYDDVDIQLNKPVQADDEMVQKEGTDAELTNIQQGNENLEISQVIENAHVTLSMVLQKSEVPVTSSSHSSDLVSKFLNFSYISHTDAEIVSPMDVHIHHEVPSKQTPTLFTRPVSIIIKSSPIYSTVIPTINTILYSITTIINTHTTTNN
uniref:Uncharacterized protein n=1 Tax=Tanacetum cinerariifolium TaxID=118510 RepID=A0A6L2LCR1_TANCI|nr:hypothetical protein [Tanacetum cinerariifolium]